MMLAALTAVLVVMLGLGVLTAALMRQVGRLRGEVRRLARPTEPAPDRPLPPVVRADDQAVITPTPIGPPEAEPDLSASRVASVTLAGPLIKVAAFSHGLRRALDDEGRMRVAYAFRKELRHQRKVRRNRSAAGPPRKEGWRP